MVKRTLPFIACYIILFALMLSLLIVFPKKDLHIFLNSFHTDIEDYFFRFYSFLAEGPLYVLFVIPLLFRQFWWTAFYAICEITGAIFVTILKHIFVMPRPLSYFGEDISSQLPIVNGIKLHSTLSFPSGHTSTFFIFFTVCVILIAVHRQKNSSTNVDRPALCQKKTLYSPWLISSQVLLLLMAAIGGYSRIYLSQHFLLDVFTGSIIGILIPFCLLPIFKKKMLEN